MAPRTPDSSLGLLRVLAIHALLGAMLGCGVGTALLVLDVAKLGTLIAGSVAPLVFGGVLFAGLALTFGSVTMGGAIMSMPREERRPPHL